jgi:hypothetical protein
MPAQGAFKARHHLIKRVRPLGTWGGGWSTLSRNLSPDRWAWFIRKIFSFFKRKSPLGRFGERPLLMEERTLRIRGLGSAFDPYETFAACHVRSCFVAYPLRTQRSRRGSPPLRPDIITLSRGVSLVPVPLRLQSTLGKECKKYAREERNRGKRRQEGSMASSPPLR